ncbi:MAG: hypothetical protein EBY80_16255 [Actinobacteria bacterium]|nr:hypothetical protein [Actinomycetota bacterium]
MPGVANVYPRFRASANVSGPKHRPVSAATISSMMPSSVQLSRS